MRCVYLGAFVCLMAMGCSNESVEQVIENQEVSDSALVRVRIENFAVTMEEEGGNVSRRAQSVDSYGDLNAVTLAFYDAENKEVFKQEQLKGSEGFGHFEIRLPMGKYKMVAVAYTTKSGSPFVLTSPTVAAYTGDHSYDTFVATKDIDASHQREVNISATLDRVVTKLQVVSTDGRTADVQNIRMSFSGGSRKFDPTTGYALDNQGLVNTVGISAGVDTASSSNSFFFLTADEQVMDVTIETLDAQGNVVMTHQVKDVPFKRNYVTKLQGAIYTTNMFGAFLVNTEWGKDMVVDF